MISARGIPVNIAIQVRTIGGDPLVDAYVRGDPGILPFFAGAPFDARAYESKAREVDARFDPDSRRAMAAAVRALGDEASERLASIASGSGYFVTTGQQPGLFGGPLYTIHKALTAVALAERLESILDAPVLALFWIASDDHDWEEANHVHVLDTGNELHRLALSGPAFPPLSMGRRSVGTTAESALDQLAEITPPSDFAPAVLKRLRAAYEPGATVAGAFAETLAGLFAGTRIGLVDAQDARIRKLGAPVIRRELEQASIHERAVEESTRKLEDAGYTSQVAVQTSSSNVFLEDPDHGRDRLLLDDGDWVLCASGRRLTNDELWSLWSSEPERFSANVLLRPVLESAVIPTLAYVAGPGEVRYLAQTRALFEAHGVGMPLVFPRLSVTLIEAKVDKVLKRFDLDVESFRRPVHELVSDVVRADVPDAVQAAIARLRASLKDGYQAVYDAAQAVDPTLKGPIFQARNDGFRSLSEVEKKIRQHVKLKQETELEQLEKAAANLAPLGKPQERVLNMHQYLARYGEGLPGAILEAMRTPVGDRFETEKGGESHTPIPSGRG